MAGLAFMIYSIVMKASNMRLSSYTGDVTLTGENGTVIIQMMILSGYNTLMIHTHIFSRKPDRP